MSKLEGIYVLKHSSIKIVKDITIYIDPFQIDIPAHDADLILCTHPHYDHFSPEDIKKVANESTVIITTEDCKDEVKKIGFIEGNIYYCKPYDNLEYEGIKISCIPAYNKHKEFHPKNKNWVGYILDIKGTKYYIAGDTDDTKEASQVECDVAFLPVGGTYTMDYIEAANLARKIDPEYVIPTHYGTIVGEPEDGIQFKSLIDGKEIKCEIYI